MANIKFGTDGWRAVVGKDFTEENVLIATKAIAKYIEEEFGLEISDQEAENIKTVQDVVKYIATTV